MFEAPDFSSYPPDVILGALAVIAIGGTLIGQITDVVMGDRGFGPFGNGLLAVLGAGVGIYVRVFYFGAPHASDLMVTAIMAAAGATGILLLLGLIKSLVET